MAKGRGKMKRRSSPQPTERPGAEEPQPAQGEVVATRPPLADMSERLRRIWAQLRALWRLFRTKVSTMLFPPLSASNSRPRLCSDRPEGHGQGQALRHAMSKLHKKVGASSTQQAPQTPLNNQTGVSTPEKQQVAQAEQDSPILMVNEHPVSRELAHQYAEYCWRTANCQGRSIVCHMCFFEKELCPNGTMRQTNILIHCYDKHNNKGYECKVKLDKQKCYIRVSTQRDLDLHMYFCHELPKENVPVSNITSQRLELLVPRQTEFVLPR